MQRQGVFLDSLYGDYKLISPALRFLCQLNNRLLCVTVKGKIESRNHTIYRLRFSDGYESDFILQDESGRWKDGGGDTEYSRAVHRELNALRGFENYPCYYCFGIEINGILSNVFAVNTSDFDASFFDIYYHGGYKFSVVKKGNGWHRGKRIPTGEDIDEEVAASVVDWIEVEQDLQAEKQICLN
jgi:hypothetical protein